MGQSVQTFIDSSRALLRRAVRAYVRSPAPRRGKGRLVTLAALLSHQGDPEEIVTLEPGVRLSLDLSSHIDRALYYTGYYHRAVMHEFVALLRPGMTVVDVGANIGEFSARAGARVGARGRVFAFEPASECFARLAANLSLSGLDNVRAERLAISDQSGEAELNLNEAGDTNRGQSSLARLGHHQRSEVVRLTRLDDYLTEQKAPRLDVLKVDTQGAELRVLRGARARLAADRPAIIVRCRESHSRAFGDSMREVQRFLRDCGYTVWEIDPQGRGPRRLEAPLEVEDATFLAKHPSVVA